MTLVEALLCTQLNKLTWKIDLIFQKESSKQGCNDTVFQHFVDELKHCNSDM